MLAAFALRAVVPVGFMPAALDAGGPFVLCPGGPGGSALTAMLDEHARHTGTEHDSTTHEAWEHCPIGAAFAAIAPVSEPDLTLPQLDHVLAPSYTTVRLRTALSTAYLARAPPAV